MDSYPDQLNWYSLNGKEYDYLETIRESFGSVWMLRGKRCKKPAQVLFVISISLLIPRRVCVTGTFMPKDVRIYF